MTTAVLIFIILGALATAFVLVRGIIIMASGKDITGKKSNKMMTYRVGLQLLTIVFVIALILMIRAGY